MVGGTKWNSEEVAELHAALNHAAKLPFKNLDELYEFVGEQFAQSSSTSAQIQPKNVKQIKGKVERIAGAVRQTATIYIQSLRTKAQDLPQDGDRTSRQSSPLTEFSDADFEPGSDAQPVNLVTESENENIGILEQEVQQSKEVEDVEDFSELVTSLRKYFRNKGFEPPPDHEVVRGAMSEVMRELDLGIDSFRKFHSVPEVTSAKLNQDAKELSDLFFLGMASHHLQTALDTLLGASMDTKVGLRMYAAAALFKWVFLDFEGLTSLESLKPTYERLSMFDEENPQLFRKVRVVDRVQHLKDVVRPSIPTLQVSCQRRLFHVFVSLASSSAWSQQEPHSGYDNRLPHAQNWIDIVNSAFHKALELRTTLEMSARSYNFGFPKLGDLFDKEWMSAAHTMADDVPEGSKVYVCLQPAIFSASREAPRDDSLMVVKAVVMVEGFPVQWNMV